MPCSVFLTFVWGPSTVALLFAIYSTHNIYLVYSRVWRVLYLMVWQPSLSGVCVRCVAANCCYCAIAKVPQGNLAMGRMVASVNIRQPSIALAGGTGKIEVDWDTPPPPAVMMSIILSPYLWLTSSMALTARDSRPWWYVINGRWNAYANLPTVAHQLRRTLPIDRLIYAL